METKKTTIRVRVDIFLLLLAGFLIGIQFMLLRTILFEQVVTMLPPDIEKSKQESRDAKNWQERKYRVPIETNTVEEPT